MYNRSGISIILADSHEEIESLLKVVEVEQAFPLKDIQQTFMIDQDAVYYAVLPNQEQMDRLLQYFSVKRGVTSVAGKRSCVGYSVDWIKLCLRRTTNPSRIPTVTVPPNVDNVLFEEKEDPFADLGYKGR